MLRCLNALINLMSCGYVITILDESVGYPANVRDSTRFLRKHLRRVSRRNKRRQNDIASEQVAEARRTSATIEPGYGRASITMLKGPWVAHRTREKPAPDTTSLILASPACAPSPSPTS